VFARDTDDECVVVVFNNSSRSRSLIIPQANSPLAKRARVKSLYGNATAQSDGTELKVMAPAQSVSIFAIDSPPSED